MPFASSGQLGPESDQERTVRANLPCESRPLAENRGQLDRSAKASSARIIGLRIRRVRLQLGAGDGL